MSHAERLDLVPIRRNIQSLYPSSIEFPPLYKGPRENLEALYQSLRSACISLEQRGWHYYHEDPVQDMRVVLGDALTSELRADVLLYITGLSPNSPGKKIIRAEAIQRVQQEAQIEKVGFTQPSEAIGITALSEVYGARFQLPPDINDIWHIDPTQAGIPYAKKRAEIARIVRIYPEIFNEIQYYYPDAAAKFLQFYRFGPHASDPYHHERIMPTGGIKDSITDMPNIRHVEAFIQTKYDYCGFEPLKTGKQTRELPPTRTDEEAYLSSAAERIKKQEQREQIDRVVNSQKIDEIGLTQLQKEIVIQYNSIRQRVGKWVTEENIAKEIIDDLKRRFPGYRFQRNEVTQLMHHVANPGEEPSGERALHDLSYKYDIHRMLEDTQTREERAKQLWTIMDTIVRLYHTEGQLGTFDAIAHQCGLKPATVSGIKRFAEQMIRMTPGMKEKSPQIYRKFVEFWPPDSVDFPDVIVELLNIYKDFDHNYTLRQTIHVFNERHMEPTTNQDEQQREFVPIIFHYFEQVLLHTMDRAQPRVRNDDLAYREREYYYRNYIANWLEPMRREEREVWGQVQNLLGLTDEDIDIISIYTRRLPDGKAPTLADLEQFCQEQGITAGYDKFMRAMHRMKTAFGEIPPHTWYQMQKDSSWDDYIQDLQSDMPREIYRWGR